MYAKSYIQRNVHFLKIIHTLLGRMSPHFSSSARTRTPIDVLALNMAYGLDVVSAFTFGIPQGTNFIHDVHARNYWFGTYLKAFPSDYMFWLLYAPGLRKWAHRIGITIAPDWIGEARRNLEQWTLQIVDNTEEALRKRSVEDMPDGDVPIVYNQLKLAHAKERYAKGADLALAPPSEERLQIASECLDHLSTCILSFQTINIAHQQRMQLQLATFLVSTH